MASTPHPALPSCPEAETAAGDSGCPAARPAGAGKVRVEELTRFYTSVTALCGEVTEEPAVSSHGIEFQQGQPPQR